MAKKRAKRRKRPRYTRESPLKCTGLVEGSASYNPRWGVMARPLIWGLKMIPSYRDTAKGRGKASLIRILFCGAGATAVTVDPIWIWGGIGVGIVLLTLILPIRHVRKAVLISRAEAWSGPRQKLTQVPAAVDYDGRKISVRVDGRVRRSLRPEDEDCEVIVEQEDNLVWIGLRARGKEGRKRFIWFCGPSAGLPEDILRQGKRPAAGAPEPIYLEANDLEEIAVAFGPYLDPKRGGTQM